MKTKIKEIFSSIQGEGPYIGQKHLFIRFCKCNLNCSFCDTDFNPQNAIDYTSEDLFKIISSNNSQMISFTGGEPLLDIDFLQDFFKKYKSQINQKVYLETNGTLYKNLEKIIDYIDIISMDIKLQSATKQINRFLNNENFLDIANKNTKETFIKIVIDKYITQEEILSCIQLAKKYNNTIILQPKMPIEEDFDIYTIFEKFYSNYQNIRLIPQVHKFLNLA